MFASLSGRPVNEAVVARTNRWYVQRWPLSVLATVTRE